MSLIEEKDERILPCPKCGSLEVGFCFGPVDLIYVVCDNCDNSTCGDLDREIAIEKWSSEKRFEVC